MQQSAKHISAGTATYKQDELLCQLIKYKVFLSFIQVLFLMHLFCLNYCMLLQLGLNTCMLTVLASLKNCVVRLFDRALPKQYVAKELLSSCNDKLFSTTSENFNHCSHHLLPYVHYVEYNLCKQGQYYQSLTPNLKIYK
jgi:hypothetical protein